LEGQARAKLRQKDRDARWTVKYSKAKPREDAAPLVDLAIPAFGYKNHVSIDRHHGLIRLWADRAENEKNQQTSRSFSKLLEQDDSSATWHSRRAGSCGRRWRYACRFWSRCCSLRHAP
jgi:hypothetical protein